MVDTPQFDITAVIAQIQTLKQQRSNALDDVAILLGQLESKTKAFDELLQKYNELTNDEKTDTKTNPGSEDTANTPA